MDKWHSREELGDEAYDLYHLVKQIVFRTLVGSLVLADDVAALDPAALMEQGGPINKASDLAEEVGRKAAWAALEMKDRGA